VPARCSSCCVAITLRDLRDGTTLEAAPFVPIRIADRFADEIVEVHKQLFGDGLDAGAVTIESHLAQRHHRAPSASTIFGS
jgi:hypothetical protein